MSYLTEWDMRTTTEGAWEYIRKWLYRGGRNRTLSCPLIWWFCFSKTSWNKTPWCCIYVLKNHHTITVTLWRISEETLLNTKLPSLHLKNIKLAFSILTLNTFEILMTTNFFSSRAPHWVVCTHTSKKECFKSYVLLFSFSHWGNWGSKKLGTCNLWGNSPFKSMPVLIFNLSPLYLTKRALWESFYLEEKVVF